MSSLRTVQTTCRLGWVTFGGNPHPESPVISSLDHLNLSVRNYPATLAWYQAVLDFQVVESGVRDGAAWAILRAGDALLCLYALPDTAPAPPRPNHVGLRVTDRARLEAALAEHAVPVLYGGPYRYPHSVSFYVEDPAGLELELSCWDDDVVRFPGDAAA